MTAIPTSQPKTYHPGDRSEATGIYRATHFRHRMPHELTVLEGETFPNCKRCGDKVRFELVLAAPRASGDLDLLMAVLALSASHLAYLVFR